MSSLSNIFNIGRRALQVQGMAMQVVGHNTANVNTEGFSRRRIDFATAIPDGIGAWNIGAGVDIDRLARVRDSLLDNQIREGQSENGYWSNRENELGRIEEVFNELGDVNIGSSLEQFWSAWHDLANDPENMPARYNLAQKAVALTSSVRSAHSSLQAQYYEADARVVDAANQVNHLTSQIAYLNTQIVAAELNNSEASDLRDARDLLVEQLSGLIDTSIEEYENGSINVYTGGQILVQNDLSEELSITQSSIDGILRSQIVYGNGNSSISFNSGEIKSLIEIRDQTILGTIEDLNNFAVNLAERVNSVHQTGFGLNNTNGIGFFADDVTTANGFYVNSIIVGDPASIATASSADAPGDNSLALQITGIQHEQFMPGNLTLDEFYRNAVLNISSKRANAEAELHVSNAAMENLENRRQSISGVSMDEEMTRMLQIQKAYDAAAKIIQTVDEMMLTILSLKASG